MSRGRPPRELRWLEYAQRLAHRRRNIVASNSRPSVGAALWRKALQGGARALGRATGAIAPGARADLVVLDGGHVDLAGREEDTILDALVFSGNDNLVRDVIVSGKWVVREGRADGEDAIAARYRNALLRLID